MENDGGQLYEEESEFVYEKEDLITIRPGREHAWLDSIIERILQYTRCRLTRVGDIAPAKIQCALIPATVAALLL